jgi:hypothetical protein
MRVNDLEREKLLVEIRSLKTQRVITILGAFAAVIVFGIGNLSLILGMFRPNPQIRLMVQDNVVNRVGAIKLYNLGTNPGSIVLNSTASAIDGRWFRMAPGPYRVEVSIGSYLVQGIDFQVVDGTDQELALAPVPVGPMRIFVKNNTENPYPGDYLRLSVDSSGNGYLWVFDWRSDGLHLIFPRNSDSGVNSISTTETFYFPEDESILAGAQPRQERLVFVVTSTPDPSFARSRATGLLGGAPAKASLGRASHDWGLAVIEYTVRQIID